MLLESIHIVLAHKLTFLLLQRESRRVRIQFALFVLRPVFGAVSLLDKVLRRVGET